MFYIKYSVSYRVWSNSKTFTHAVFLPTATTLLTPKFYGLAPPTSKFQPTPPKSPRPKFYGPTLPTPPTPKFDPPYPRTHAIYATHEPTLLMPPTLFSRFPRVSYLMFSVQTLEDARFKIKMREMHHKESFCRQKYRFHSRSKEKPNAIHFNNDFFFKFLKESKRFFLVYNSVII